MQKLISFLIVLLSVLSCSEDHQLQPPQIKMYKQDASLEFKSAVRNLVSNSVSGRLADVDVIFDVDNMQVVSTDESSTLSLVANQVGFSLDNDIGRHTHDA